MSVEGGDGVNPLSARASRDGPGWLSMLVELKGRIGELEAQVGQINREKMSLKNEISQLKEGNRRAQMAEQSSSSRLQADVREVRNTLKEKTYDLNEKMATFEKRMFAEIQACRKDSLDVKSSIERSLAMQIDSLTIKTEAKHKDFIQIHNDLDDKQNALNAQLERISRDSTTFKTSMKSWKEDLLQSILDQTAGDIETIRKETRQNTEKLDQRSRAEFRNISNSLNAFNSSIETFITTTEEKLKKIYVANQKHLKKNVEKMAQESNAMKRELESTIEVLQADLSGLYTKLSESQSAFEHDTNQRFEKHEEAMKKENDERQASVEALEQKIQMLESSLQALKGTLSEYQGSNDDVQRGIQNEMHDLGDEIEERFQKRLAEAVRKEKEERNADTSSIRQDLDTRTADLTSRLQAEEEARQKGDEQEASARQKDRTELEAAMAKQGAEMEEKLKAEEEARQKGDEQEASARQKDRTELEAAMAKQGAEMEEKLKAEEEARQKGDEEIKLAALKAIEEKEAIANGTRESASALEQKILDVETSMSQLMSRDQCQELVQAAKTEMMETLTQKASETAESCMSEISKVGERTNQSIEELKASVDNDKAGQSELKAEIEKELRELEAKLEEVLSSKMKSFEESSQGQVITIVEERVRTSLEATSQVKTSLEALQGAVDKLQEWSKTIEDVKQQPNSSQDASQIQSLQDLYASQEKKINQNYDDLNFRIDRLEIDALRTRVTDLSKKLAEKEATLNSHTQSIIELLGKLDKLMQVVEMLSEDQ
uniref:Uncharacterized protein n=1 Tax=Guillardia theta TaxID=55529 RepID=A0A7S4JGF0_GUITH